MLKIGQSKATYRLIENDRVIVAALVKAEAEATALRCAGLKEIRVLVDLTTLSFPNAHATEDLEPVGEEGSLGMLVQSALAAKNVTIPVPSHPGDVPIGTLRAIVREMDVSVDEFNNL